MEEAMGCSCGKETMNDRNRATAEHKIVLRLYRYQNSTVYSLIFSFIFLYFRKQEPTGMTWMFLSYKYFGITIHRLLRR
jgi:hypothetical protein